MQYEEENKRDACLTEEELMQFLTIVGTWFDERELITMLKVLYRDSIPLNQLDKASTTMELLHYLLDSGKLSREDLGLIYETIKITEQFGLQNKLKQFKSNKFCLNLKDTVIKKFSHYRQKLIMLGKHLREADMWKIDERYNMPAKKYKDTWSLITDLEHHQNISEGRMEAFIETLKLLKLNLAVETLAKDLNECATLSVIGKKRKHCSSNLPDDNQHHQKKALTADRPIWQEELNKKEDATNDRPSALEEQPHQKMALICDQPSAADPEMTDVFKDAIQDTARVHSFENLKLKEFKLRNYQVKLAKPVINGNNTIIISHTGSGKTYVAVHFVMEHLKRWKAEKNCNAKPKVLFLLKTIALVNQQHGVFERYFSDSIRFCKMFGDGKEKLAPFKNVVETNDIIFLTAQIFLNALQNIDIKIEDFSMLIFDECHHCHSENEYNEIMAIYRKKKLETEKATLPQIVGLTASVGTGKAKSQIDSDEHAKKICANLDVESISLPDENDEEYQLHNNPPKEIDPISVKPRSEENDPFKSEITSIMLTIEQMLQSGVMQLDCEVKGLTELLKFTDCQKGSCAYEQKVENFVSYSPNYMKPNNNTILRLLRTGGKHLRKYNDSLKINHICRIEDALRFIKDFIDKEITHADGFNEDDERLVQLFKEMTPADQQKVLQKFKSDKCNILIGTSVVEEGIDVPDCNLVIRYEYMSSDVGRKQAKGRIRQMNGKFYMITSTEYNFVEGDQANRIRDVFMMKSVRTLSELPKDKLKEELLSLQRVDLNDRIKKEQRREKSKTIADYKLLCGKCSEFACNSFDIMLFNNSYHLIVSEKFYKFNILVEKHPKPKRIDNINKHGKIFCAKCKQDWGVMVTIGNMDFAVIKISSFILQNCVNDQKLTYKKWKDCPLNVQNFNLIEFKIQNPEWNVDQK